MAFPAAGTPDFLVCGHAVEDLLDGSEDTPWRLGGAVAYASLLAQRLGLRAAVLTSAGPNLNLEALLPGIEVSSISGEHSTQMRNMYERGRRHQQMPQRASRIGAEHLPDPWRSIPVVLLGPVAGEIDDSLAACFPRSLVGAGAQGWLRDTGPDANVRPVPPKSWRAAPVLAHVGAFFVSDEDIPPDDARDALADWCSVVETVAYTRGYNGAEIYHNGEWRHIDAFPAKAVDPTGAGDIFAAAFLIRLHETRDVWDATRFASCAASFVVEGEGVSAVPDRKMVERRIHENPHITARVAA